MKPNHPIPAGYRRLKPGEIANDNDLINSLSNTGKYGEKHHGFLFIKDIRMTDKIVRNDDCLAFYRKISRKNKKN